MVYAFKGECFACGEPKPSDGATPREREPPRDQEQVPSGGAGGGKGRRPTQQQGPRETRTGGKAAPAGHAAGGGSEGPAQGRGAGRSKGHEARRPGQGARQRSKRKKRQVSLGPRAG